MTPEAASALRRAWDKLQGARRIAEIGVLDVAAREAYLAVHGAAQALVFERTGRIVKTHSGVRTQVALFARDDSSIDPALPGFLARAYGLKEFSDYGGPRNAPVSAEETEWALGTAAMLVENIARVLGTKLD